MADFEITKKWIREYLMPGKTFGTRGSMCMQRQPSIIRYLMENSIGVTPDLKTVHAAMAANGYKLENPNPRYKSAPYAYRVKFKPGMRVR